MASPSKDHIAILHDYGIHLPTRTLMMESAVDDEGEENGVNYTMATKFFKNMHLLEASSKDPITIILNTGGGDIGHGMAIYDRISNSRCHITIKVYGHAESMGSIILQAADDRVLAPHSKVMFHLGEGGAACGNPEEILSHATFQLDYGRKIDRILYERIRAKHDQENRVFTKNKFKEMNFRGKYMTAQEAVDFGLADRIEGM